MRREPPGYTLQPTALVHEAYLRLVESGDPGWVGKGHFFGAAARAMRRILVESARRRKTLKRGGNFARVDLEDAELLEKLPPEDILSLDEALEEMEAEDPRLVQVVMLRFFAGRTIPETAEILEVSPATVSRDWVFARTWLYRKLSPGFME